MTSKEAIKNIALIENIDFQSIYFRQVLLKQFSSEVHRVSLKDDVLVEKFYEKFYNTLIIELENYKEKFQHMCNDLQSLANSFEKAIKLVDYIDENMHDYELYLTITESNLKALLHQIDVEISKLSIKIQG